jgi:endonuclease/exonuclease/phosphatase family metal-dependent hydrolase
MTRLRIATFNIRHGAPKHSYRGLPDELAAACASLDADVLALQEVDVGVPRSQNANLAKVAADACGMTYYFAKARKHAYRGQYGNALLVRGTISEVTVVRLDGDHRHTLRIGRMEFKPFREPRNAIIATATVRGHALSIGTGHFAADTAARRPQLTTTAQHLVARPEPRILLGDLNVAARQAAEWLAPYGLTVVGPLAPPATGKRLEIDHVAVCGVGIERVESRWLPISDHPAKIVEVTVTR